MLVAGPMIVQILEAVSVLVSASAPLQQRVEEQRVTEFSATYVTPVRAALSEFKKTHANWSCFQVIVVPQSDDPQILQIGFASDYTVTSDPKSGTLTIGPPQKCGPGASYLVRADGAILQRIGHPRPNKH
jgi:hypothetical protein